VGRPKQKIDEKKLSSWKLLDDFRRRLAKPRAAMPARREERAGGNEWLLLLEEDYFSLMLFGLLNPVPDSMRGLSAVRAAFWLPVKTADMNLRCFSPLITTVFFMAPQKQALLFSSWHPDSGFSFRRDHPMFTPPRARGEPSKPRAKGNLWSQSEPGQLFGSTEPL